MEFLLHDYLPEHTTKIPQDPRAKFRGKIGDKILFSVWSQTKYTEQLKFQIIPFVLV